MYFIGFIFDSYIRAATMHLQRPDSCNQNDHIWLQAWDPTFDIEELLHPDVCSETSFCHCEETHKAEKPTQTSHKNKIIYLICKYFIQMPSYFFAATDPAGAALVEHRKTMQRGAQKKRAAVYRIAVCSGKLKWEVSSQGLSKAKGPLIWRALHTGLLNTIQTKQIVHLERQPVLG